MATLCDPVIVVPGTFGSRLVDVYPMAEDVLWGTLSTVFATPGGLERLAVHPSDEAARYEALGPSRVLPRDLLEVAYRELVEELRSSLGPRGAGIDPVPVHTFAYDWRLPVAVNGALLRAFVEEVADRTALLRHYDADGYGKRRTVHLIGHSLGGLVIVDALAPRPDDGPAPWAKRHVGKVVTLGTPYRGAVDAVSRLLQGLGGLWPTHGSHRDREPARLTPSAYHMLPSWEPTKDHGILDLDYGDHAGAGALALFERTSWQPSVERTFADYVERYGLGLPKDKEARARRVREGAQAALDRMLTLGRGFTERAAAFDLAAAGLAPEQWLAIVGLDKPTRIGLTITTTPAGPVFDLSDRHVQNHWTPQDPDPRTGDGTVPLRGALPPFLPPERVVGVRPSDVDTWEIADRIFVGAAFHAAMPEMNLVQRLVTRFLKDAPDPYGNTWGWRVPGAAAWAPPIAGLGCRGG